MIILILTILTFNVRTQLQKNHFANNSIEEVRSVSS